MKLKFQKLLSKSELGASSNHTVHFQCPKYATKLTQSLYEHQKDGQVPLYIYSLYQSLNIRIHVLICSIFIMCNINLHVQNLSLIYKICKKLSFRHFSGT